MPTYDYECSACGHKFEEFQSISAELLTKCPKCKKKKLVRLFGAGAAVMFKGSGFYTTDYRSESYKSAAASDKSSASSSESSSSSSEAKPAPKAESKPAKTESAPKSSGKKGDK
ncbi:regulatory protein, FmdB family [Pirellula staleyi DSM 6068]|uniref:Regulatory protein, FmdB family n=1 Tax=Pirellula staleyi (strain ATCC 27377 / DSM 6068 / ICPB 4128) TaxID=530564 RepID=D2R9E3_PIRSD|nr:zinc ribbon domain-containing protein [Pirellula staleyi]ADB17693.1 regulatory protein, FmdB family [Pirellula staleyi DSM 6068]